MCAFLAHDLTEPLVWVDILNSYNDKEFLSDKLSIVDVKARDSHEKWGLTPLPLIGKDLSSAIERRLLLRHQAHQRWPFELIRLLPLCSILYI